MNGHSATIAKGIIGAGSAFGGLLASINPDIKEGMQIIALGLGCLVSIASLVSIMSTGKKKKR